MTVYIPQRFDQLTAGHIGMTALAEALSGCDMILYTEPEGLRVRALASLFENAHGTCPVGEELWSAVREKFPEAHGEGVNVKSLELTLQSIICTPPKMATYWPATRNVQGQAIWLRNQLVKKGLRAVGTKTVEFSGWCRGSYSLNPNNRSLCIDGKFVGVFHPREVLALIGENPAAGR